MNEFVINLVKMLSAFLFKKKPEIIQDKSHCTELFTVEDIKPNPLVCNVRPKLEQQIGEAVMVYTKIGKVTPIPSPMAYIPAQKVVDESVSLAQDLRQHENYQIHAVRLLIFSCWLKQEQQADLIEMRQFWYGDRPLNFWTHLSVGLKTQKYLIFDLFFFSTIQKIKHKFQPMKKDRLSKIKSSD